MLESGGMNPERTSMNRTAQLTLAWSGFALLGFAVGGLVLGRFVPPWTSPQDSAAKVAEIYADHPGQLRAALVLVLAGVGLIGVWGVSMAAQTRRKEGIFPALTYCQLTCTAAATALIMLMTCLWATAAFRAGDVSPEITQTLNDAAYIILLATWVPFTVWTWSVGLTVLLDRSDSPVYPRWAGYLSMWAGLLYVPGNTVWFFKDGAFGWTGVICLYVPFAAFGIWVVVLTLLTIRNIKGGLVHEQDLQPTT